MSWTCEVVRRWRWAKQEWLSICKTKKEQYIVADALNPNNVAAEKVHLHHVRNRHCQRLPDQVPVRVSKFKAKDQVLIFCRVENRARFALVHCGRCRAGTGATSAGKVEVRPLPRIRSSWEHDKASRQTKDPHSAQRLDRSPARSQFGRGGGADSLTSASF